MTAPDQKTPRPRAGWYLAAGLLQVAVVLVASGAVARLFEPSRDDIGRRLAAMRSIQDVKGLVDDTGPGALAAYVDAHGLEGAYCRGVSGLDGPVLSYLMLLGGKPTRFGKAARCLARRLVDHPTQRIESVSAPVSVAVCEQLSHRGEALPSVDSQVLDDWLAGLPVGVDCLRGLAALASSSPRAKRNVRAFLHRNKRAGPEVFRQVGALGDPPRPTMMEARP